MIIDDKSEYITPEMSFDRTMNKILHGNKETEKNKNYELILTNSKHQATLNKYYLYCKQVGNSPKTIVNKMKLLKYFFIFVKKDVSKIKKDGIINEPLLVYKNQVIEGNTRLWVARELLKKAKDLKEKKIWETLPCRLIKGEINEEEINHILCNVHIKRKKDWLPFEQACYITRMKKEGISVQKIKEISTFGIKTINDYIDVYKEMEKHHAEPGDWNRYYEAYKDKEVKDSHISGKIDIFETIKKKTKEGKMGVARDSRKIKKILTSKRATNMFFAGDSDVHRAYDVAILENPEEGDPLLKRVKELDEDLRHIAFDKLEEIKKDKTKMEVIKGLSKQIKRLCKELKITF
jgi:hypothetical protein